MDIWLMSQVPDDDALPDLIGALISMIRGAVGRDVAGNKPPITHQ